MSAELLRRAAALMRERAEAAKGGQWETSEERAPLLTEWAIFSPDAGHDFALVEDEGSAEHIASWNPAVALAVAPLLEALAARADDITQTIGSPRVATSVVASTLTGFNEAVAFARAYLGEQPC